MHLVGTSVSYDPVSLRELYELIRKQPKLSSKPGTYYYYNDGGMRLAAMILEKVSGLSFRQAMRELLFDPAEMPSADIKPWEPMYFPREAATYLMDKTLDGDINQTAIRIGTVVPETSGDGAGVGTMQDLIQFARFIGTKPDDGPTYLQRLVEPVYYRPGLYGAYRTDFAVTLHRNMRVYCHFGFYGKGMLYLPDKDMKPDEVYEVRVDLQSTSNYFGPGHRIRLEVSSSNFPRFDRNLNTGGDNETETS